MYNEPKRGWTITFLILAGLCLAAMIAWPQSPWMILPDIIAAVSAIAAFFLGVEWMLTLRENMHRKRREADAITPTYLAAQAVRFLSPEALAVIPKWEHTLSVGHIVTPAGREDVLITTEAVLPFSFVHDFLVRSSYTRLEKIGNYPGKTKEREFAQAMTAELCRKGYALPANGNEPALWLTAESRKRFADELGIELPEGI